jgi:hypothetical protein
MLHLNPPARRHLFCGRHAGSAAFPVDAFREAAKRILEETGTGYSSNGTNEGIAPEGLPADWTARAWRNSPLDEL